MIILGYVEDLDYDIKISKERTKILIESLVVADTHKRNMLYTPSPSLL